VTGDLEESLAIWVLREERVAQGMWAREEWLARPDRRERKGSEDQEESGACPDRKERLALLDQTAGRAFQDCLDLRASQGRMVVQVMLVSRDCRVCQALMVLKGIEA